MPPIITMLTDFGDKDGYVGVMKGVMLAIAPQAQLIDLSHQIGPQDVKGAAFVLATAAPFFPAGTTHLIVIDPGVGGSEHRRIAVETPVAHFVAPDNGVLSYALAGLANYAIVELTNPKYRLPSVSTTFHGRDIFSPAAAHLAMGVPFDDLGDRLETIVTVDPPHLHIEQNTIKGEVLSVDHFGNIRTSIRQLTRNADTLSLRPGNFGHPNGAHATDFSANEAQVSIGALTVNGISTTYSSVDVGQPVAFVGSSGGLEIAINRGNAATKFAIRPGQHVTLRFKS